MSELRKKLVWGVKIVGKTALVCVVVFCLFNCNSIWYGIQQGRGQLKIVWGAEKFDHYLKDENYPDSLKQKIQVVQEIREFAFDSLGLEPTKNYTKMYDQKGEPGMWVVTACSRYSLTSYKWKFPFLGAFGYKGYFNKKKAMKEAEELKAEGYDTDVSVVNAWSTLGWFKDPVMSSMLEKSNGQLARLLIHELTHSTLFVKNNVQFNENLASYIGDIGGALFLKSKYGEGSEEYIQYLQKLEDYKKIRTYLLRSTKALKVFYEKEENRTEKRKRAKINEVIANLDTLDLVNTEKIKLFIKNKDQINNTFFTDFLMYREDQQLLDEEFKVKFKGNFKNYFVYLKQKYPSI